MNVSRLSNYLVGTDSTPSLTLLCDGKTHITDAVERVLTSSRSVRTARRPWKLPMMRPLQSCASAFTLIELVISSALMSMILVSAYLCLHGGITSQKLVESRADILQGARVALAIMSADLRSACVLSKSNEFLGMARTMGDVQADNLDFATHHYTPKRMAEGDWCEVSYFLDQNPESGVFSLWRRRDPTPDLEPLSGGNREEIAHGLRGLKFEYYDGFEWFDSWGDPDRGRKEQFSLREQTNLSGLPEAVRITLWVDSNPRQNSTTEPREDKEAVAPPITFQTVVRLNLAGVSTPSTSSGPPDNTSGNPTSPTAPGARRGGN